MSTGKDIRRQRRIAYVGPIRISWEDQGQPRFALAKCIDISETGVRIEAPQPVRIGATIQLAAERIKLAGSATVKNVIRNGSKFLLGVQLNHAMPGDAIAEMDRCPIENLNRIHQKV
jgi:PilZ domain